MGPGLNGWDPADIDGIQRQMDLNPLPLVPVYSTLDRLATQNLRLFIFLK